MTQAKQDQPSLGITRFFTALTPKVAILTILVVGLTVFSRTFSNNFIGDDYEQIVNNPLVHSISNIPVLFQQGTFFDEAGQRNNYYKPVMGTTFTIIYSLFGANPFGYHLAQVLLHLVNAILIFLILRYFFTNLVSLFLALIFVVHPINTESVVYISNLQENLFLFFGLLSFYLAAKKADNFYINLLITFLLLLSLLAKETGAVFLVIIPFFTALNKRAQFWKSFTWSAGALISYLFLRQEIAKIQFGNAAVKIVPIQTLDLSARLMNIPKIIWFYLTTFFYPKSLISFQSWIIKSPTLQGFYLPLLADIIFFAAFVLIGLVISKRNRHLFTVFLFFSTWFLIGLVIHLQIIPLDQTVADRWFYFPIIGLLGVIGTIAEHLTSDKGFKLAWLFLPVSVIIVLLALRTIVREQDWKDDETLASHDVKLNPDSYQLKLSLAGLANSKGDKAKAEQYYISATKLFPNEIPYGRLGDFYLQNHMPEKAISAYTQALSYNWNYALAWMYLAIAKYEGGDKSGALAAAKRAYEISPSKTFATFLDAVKNDEPITIR